MVPIITLIVVLTSKRAKDSSNDRGLKFCPKNTELTVSTARSSGLYDDLSEKEIISEGFYTQPNISEYNSLQRCKHQRQSHLLDRVTATKQRRGY